MSDNSLDSLLQWMADPASNVLWGWDCIAAMARDKTNLLLAQAYIGRFGSASYLPPVNGRVAMVEGQFEQHIHDFLLDVPLLSFDNASLDNARARLSMSVMGGIQVAMDREATTWKTVAVHDIDPLQGPRLYLDLQLDKVPGLVGQEGQVKLDLRLSDNFTLTFAETEHERRLGGEFFKDLFNQLPDAQRVFVLGSIEPGGNPQLRPQSFKLRGQSHSADAAQGDEAVQGGDGAILVFIRMAGGTEGAIPGASFRYLIPDDAGKDYSATVLLERRRAVSQMALVEAVMAQAGTLFQDLRFDTVTGPHGKLESAVASGGRVRFDSAMLGTGPFIWGNGLIYLRSFFTGMEVQANSKVPFSIRLDPDLPGVRIHWEWEGSCRRRDDYLPRKGLGYEQKFAERQYTLRFEVLYTLGHQGAELVLRPERFDVREDYSERRWTEQAYGDVDFDESNPRPTLELTLELMQFINARCSPQMNPSLKAALERQMNVAFVFSELINDCIRLNFGEAIVSAELRIPADIGAFGRINPLATRFEIDPMRPRLMAGATLSFSVRPAVSGVAWTVEALDGGAVAGSIDANGLYRAPVASALAGRFLRVRVTASKEGYRSSALVSVMRNALTVNPLISLCHIDEACELAAGQLGAGQADEGALIWSVHNPVEREKGSVLPSSLPDGDHTYVPVRYEGTPEHTYIVDEVQVRNPATGQAVSVHVLVTLYRPELSIGLVDSELPAGQVQLRAYAYGNPWDEVRWYLPLGGPGTLDSQGLYRADDTALQRYVLIIAEATEYPEAAGHIILPLPLKDFPAEQALMTHSPATGLTLPEAGPAGAPTASSQASPLAAHPSDELLQWMAEPASDVLCGWDAIAAMNRSKTNALLAQAYVAGFAEGSFVPPMSEEVLLVGGRFKQCLHEVTLGAPQLSFENAGSDGARARLSLALVGGLDVGMKNDGGLWRAWKVSRLTLQPGAQVYLDLQLDRVPGTVGEQGRVMLDLRHSDNFHLTLSDEEQDQREGGELFRRLFNALPDEQRVFVLGTILPGGQPALRPQAFQLRTRRAGPDDREGALLILLRLGAGQGGTPLPASSPWLIPDDADRDYSASLLLQRQHVLEGSVMHMLGELIGGQHFDLHYDAAGSLRSATSCGGQFVAPPAHLQLMTLPGQSGEPVPVLVSTEALLIDAVAPQALQVDFASDVATITWSARGEVVLTVALGEATLPLRLTCSLELDAAYVLSQRELNLRRGRWNLTCLLLPPPPPDTQAQGDSQENEGPDAGKIIFYWALIWAALAVAVPNTVVKGAIEETFSAAFDPDAALNTFIHDTLHLNFAHALEPETLHLPRDLAVFGRVSPLLSHFELTPMQARVMGGTTLQLAARPARSGLRWTLENVSGGGQSPGSISAQGLYSAPPATAIGQSGLQVRVTATDAEGHLAAALVSVVRSDVTLDPLIQECEAGASVRLQAGQLGSGPLTWTLRSCVEGPSGSLQPGLAERTYTAPAPSADDYRYGLDEIDVRSGSSGAGSLAYVLVPPPGNPVNIRVADTLPASSGRIQLLAFSSNTPLANPQWHLPLGGPGTIDAEGVYVPDAAASADFVLVMVKGARLGRVVEGHLILPLPLASFALPMAG